jgi:hypothetical protein
LQALPLLALLSQSVRAVVLVLALLHLRQLRQRGTMTAQLLMLPMLLLLVVFQLLLLVPRRWRRCVPVLLRRPALLLLLLLLLLLDCLIQLLLQLLLLLVVQLLVLLARTPSIQLRGRTAGCLLQLLTSTVPSATTPYARAADELAPMSSRLGRTRASPHPPLLALPLLAMWWRTQHPEMLKQAMTIGAALTWFSAATVMVRLRVALWCS